MENVNKMTSAYFKRNYYAKVYGELSGKRVNTLVTLNRLVDLFGDFAFKFIDNFNESGLDRKQYKLRSKTYKVTIYAR